MRFLHTSDWHVGRRIGGRDRSEEHEAVLSELIDIADDRSVDLTLVAGDVFDTGSPSPTSERIVYETLLKLAEIAPVLVIAGNHDNSSRLDAIAPVLTHAGVTVVGAPRPASEGGVVTLSEAGVSVAMLPFVSQRGIVKAEHVMGSDPDENAGRYSERMSRIIDSLVEAMPEDLVSVVMGHMTVFDAKHGGGERMAHTVFDYAVPASVFPGHIAYAALGHLHRQQPVPHPAPVWYSGSPMQLDFGEVEDRKGALLVEATPGLPATVTEIPIKSSRRLVTLHGSLDDILGQAGEHGDSYLKVVLAEPPRVGLADEVRAEMPNAVIVAVEETVSDRPSSKPRSDLDPRSAFSSYLEERGASDDEVETLFAELLDEVPA